MSMELGFGVYLVISIAMTFWVARTLSRNGEVFLIRCFGQDEALARSTNHLLVVGFYLVNLGFVGVRMAGWVLPPGESLVAYVGSKIGMTLLILGAMHFLNMMMIARYGRTVGQWTRAQVALAGGGETPRVPQ